MTTLSRERFPAQLTVFSGPSLAPRDAQRLLPGATVRPPAKRGDLYDARERGAAVILLIDGVFAHQFAVSPREVIDVIRDGALLIGASSIGALRAVECQRLGMVGVGVVYRLFRAGILESDDEVAVATNPDGDYSATSVALVNVRHAIAKARRTRLIESAAADDVVTAARHLYFPERTWRAILRAGGVADEGGRLQALCQSMDLKRADARRAVRYTRDLASDDALVAAHAASGRVMPRPKRYPGHDPLFGEDPEHVRTALCRWLFGSGRYERYVWPLVISEPEFSGVPGASSERSAAVRATLQHVVARLAGDVNALSQRLWDELVFLGELDAELVRWHAYRSLAASAAASGVRVSNNVLMDTFREVGRAHDVSSPAASREGDDNGHLLGAVPFEWIEMACRQIALARRFASQVRPDAS